MLLRINEMLLCSVCIFLSRPWCSAGNPNCAREESPQVCPAGEEPVQSLESAGFHRADNVTLRQHV